MAEAEVVLSSEAYVRAVKMGIARALGGIITSEGGFEENVVATLAEEIEEFMWSAIEEPAMTWSDVEDKHEDASWNSFETSDGGEELIRWIVDESAAAEMLRSASASTLPIGVEESDIEDMAKMVLSELRKETKRALEKLERELSEQGCCELCGREGTKITRHHLRPRETHKRYLARGTFTKKDLQKTARCCRSCHSAIHAFVPDNDELAEHYYTVERLLSIDKLLRYVQWVSRQQSTSRPKLRK